MGEKEIVDKLVTLKKELMRFKTQLASRVSPENPGKGRAIKKTISRLNTRLNSLSEREVKNKGE